MSSGRSGGGLASPSGGPIIRSGHLKKLKTLKKKYFVLRGEAPGYSACLEYYDSKKKFLSRQPPKRSICLHSCFNINRRVDTKYKHVIALYTKDECFCLILENEKDLEEWLKAMLLLQSGDIPDGEQPRPTFEHVWQVTMQKKGLGERKNIHGPYRLCLTDRTLSLVKVGAEDPTQDSLEFSLICIRRCGYMDRIFYMEVGRSAVTGGGEFWMEAEDNNIAHNMHAAILNAMSNSGSGKDEVGPRQRMRSSSANEASKPISVLQRRHTGQKLHSFSPLGTSGRDRCDSLPSRARTSSEGHPVNVVLGHPRSSHFVPHVPRPHSMYGRGVSYSPPVSSMPISPASGACSTDSAGSSLSMDDGGENTMEEGPGSRYGHSLTPDEPVILEENGDDYALWSNTQSHHKYSPNLKSHSPSQQSSYVEMYSPCGSSPGRGGAYMPMSPATTVHSHSRASSLVEENNGLTEGYVPMAPVGDDGYVDMDPTNGHFPDDMSQHGGSSCSVTSGTPSTDLRFSEYHLDKVTSFLTPGEDLQARPTRAYSVGSRPEPINRHRKNRLDIVPQEASRVRAFSVGSRSKRPEIGRLANVMTTTPLPTDNSEGTNSNKSNSAPLLSSSWGHNSGCSGVSSDRMEDLMELDFTKPSISNIFSSPSSSLSQSHSQSCSTATDISSYVDMSPGQQPLSTTAAAAVAPYVDMSGFNKINRNNNNNTITANQNHNLIHGPSTVSTHKSIVSTLKPVEEAESPYMRMDGSLEDWSQSGMSPKQVPSPLQEDCVQTNGPPGGARTAPVDLPQPRRPPEGYVEMSFKTRPSLEQDYINMSMGLGGRNNSVYQNYNGRRTSSISIRKEKLCSQPIAIQASSKLAKAPSFLPLNVSPRNESLDSTPVSPPRATPTGSSSTIFPFSLNSPQSPVKPFTSDTKEQDFIEIDNLDNDNDYAIMDPARMTTAITKNSIDSHVIERNFDSKSISDVCSNTQADSNADGASSPIDESSAITKSSEPNVINKNIDTIIAHETVECSPLSQKKPPTDSSPSKENNNQTNCKNVTQSSVKTIENAQNVLTKTMKDSNLTREERNSKETIRRSTMNAQDALLSPIMKKLDDLTVSKPRLVNASPNTNPTLSGFKPPNSQIKISSSSPKLVEETSTPTSSTTCTPIPSPLDAEGFDKLQLGTGILHYASLDLPETATDNMPPISPAAVREIFNYAEIDFAKLKQN